MSKKLKSSLPGIFSIVVLAIGVVVKLTDGVPIETVDYVTGALLLVASWLGISWVPPRLPSQEEE